MKSSRKQDKKSLSSASDPILHTWEHSNVRKKMNLNPRLLNPHLAQKEADLSVVRVINSDTETTGVTKQKECCCCGCLVCCFFCCTTGLFLFCPPIPSKIVSKLAFHPPPRGLHYYLTYIDSNGKEIEAVNAKQAFKLTSVKFVSKVEIKEFNQFATQVMKEAEVFIVKTHKKNYLVGVFIKFNKDNLNLSNKKSHALSKTIVNKKLVLLFSQANATDLGTFAQLDFNLRDISSALNVDVYAFDYSGFGKSTGTASEQNIYADIEAVYDHICSRINNDTRIVLIGYSMGTSACVNMASKCPDQLAGVVLLAPFTSGCRLIRSMPDQIKTNCGDAFCSIDKIGIINVPVLLIHGAMDEIVPIAHSLALYKRLSRPVRPLYLRRANHSEIFSTIYPEIINRIKKFFQEEI